MTFILVSVTSVEAVTIKDGPRKMSGASLRSHLKRCPFHSDEDGSSAFGTDIVFNKSTLSSGNLPN